MDLLGKRSPLSKDCPRQLAGKPITEKIPQAMLAAWEDSEADEEDERPAKDTCLMAPQEETTEKVTKSKSYKKISESELLL